MTIEDMKDCKKPEPCEWCGNLMEYIGDGAENVDVSGFSYCPNCGRKLEADE